MTDDHNWRQLSEKEITKISFISYAARYGVSSSKIFFCNNCLLFKQTCKVAWFSNKPGPHTSGIGGMQHSELTYFFDENDIKRTTNPQECNKLRGLLS